ncbi:unnamed protein product [Allacma fusca]|uniref:CRAL-TRIO domain-containing protein n=1 Tax=Allacma fusca TaxID=39272 RepID=A0A8J2KV12_9HEXA|nr:unnamed protein product [Allacma fusca]
MYNILPAELVQALNATEEWQAPNDVINSYPYYFSGFDEENRPILVCEFGKWDLRRFFDEGRDVNILHKYVDQALDRFVSGPPKELYPEGNAADGTVLIADLDGFNIRQVASAECFRLILGIASKFSKLEKHLAYGFFINLNYLAERTYEVARPLLGSLVERVEVYGTNSAKWIPKLLRALPADQLPPWYGGPKKHFSPVVVYG